MSNKTPDEIWTKILSELGEKAQNDPFLNQAKPLILSNSNLTISVPASFTMDKIRERYSDKINDLLGQITDNDVSLNFIVAEPQEKDISTRHRKTSSKNLSNDTHDSSLNTRYTFDNFVVGRSNQLAQAAALAVAENPGKVYNPLFIYGGVGLGKTHLLHAIGNRVKKSKPELKVLYVSSETFMNDMIESIRNVSLKNRATADFRNKYRTNDVLLIDDIQFLQKKEGTQEEFFNTFNELHLNSKHIVLTSDKHPKNMPTLEERLRSRFEWGMVTDIVPPELETRIAILQQKSEEQGFDDIPDDVIIFIAETVENNIRDLEGALIRVVSYADVYKTQLTVDSAKEALKNTIEISTRRLRKKSLTIQDVQKEIADYFGVTVEELKSSKRPKSIAWPRQIAMYLAKQLIGSSYTEIGDAFGGRDHTTVLYACNKVDEELKTDQDLKIDIENLSDILKK